MKTIVIISLCILGIVAIISQFLPGESVEYVVSYLAQFGF